MVLAVASFSNINTEELLIVLGNRSSFQYTPVHELVAAMNPIYCHISVNQRFKYSNQENQYFDSKIKYIIFYSWCQLG